MKYKPPRYNEIHGVSTICKGPLCEKKHKVRMNWIGRGVPKMFCPVCKGQQETYYDPTEMMRVHAAMISRP